MSERHQSVVLSVRLAYMFYNLAIMAKAQGQEDLAHDFALQSMQCVTMGLKFLIE